MSSVQPSPIDIKVRRFEKQLRYFLIALAVVSIFSLFADAQDHSHTQTQHQGPTPDQQSALLKIVRDSTARFNDVRVAEYEGYHLEFGCVSGPDSGAMGLHYVNDTLVGNGVLDPTRPQIILQTEV
jgi:hypothetical protein